MIDLGISKLALIGAVALIVIGPDKLPSVARTLGALIARARRYLNDVKAEISRNMALDEFKKMHDSVQTAAHDVRRSIQTGMADFDPTGLQTVDASQPDLLNDAMRSAYHPPQKNWRIRRSAVPHWYKVRAGVRTHALSGAARVARFRPVRPKRGDIWVRPDSPPQSNG